MRAQFEKTIAASEQMEQFRLSPAIPEEAERIAIAFMSVAPELRRYQRYAKSALAQRKRAIRDLRWLNESEAAAATSAPWGVQWVSSRQ